MTAPVLSELLAAAERRLAAAGVPSPRFDAEELAAHVLGVRRPDLAPTQELEPSTAGRLDDLVSRRAERDPLQHLTGEAPFRYLVLEVGPGVFVPRPETELVAGAAIDEARRVLGGGRTPVVVDLCTGSGAIAASVAQELEGAKVLAVEREPQAYAFALRNLAGTGADVRLGDAANAFPELDGRVDVVVSNPPYVPDGALIRDPEVLAHDPAAALWGGGADGLEVPRQVAARAAELLRPGGLFVMEHGDLQRDDVLRMLASGGEAAWVDVADHRDLAGRDRFVTARRPGAATDPAG